MIKRNIIIASIIMLFTCPSLLMAEKKVRYISPNNDGVQDELVIPLKITDKRMIMAWSLIIVDADGNEIRTIGNKIALPEKIGFKSFFKQLVTPKEGVEIPASVTWNGVMDNGETAPDGLYYYYFTATDDNGNTGCTSNYPVVIDTKAPIAQVNQPGDKIFGEGAKADFKVQQSGSKEDKWVGRFRNSVGEVVRTFTWEDIEPEAFKWNGKDDNGKFVKDGVYSYELTATDRAGNVSNSSGITNIIYSAEKPVISISINGGKYFSPDTESRLSTISFAVKIPVPEADSGNKLIYWNVDVVGSDGKVYRTYKNEKGENPPSQIVFDGKDEKGNRIAQGKYKAVLSAKYLNGYEPAKESSPEFVLDVTKPGAQIILSDKSFGGGAKRNLTISMLTDVSGKYAPVPAWTGRIISAENPDKVVRTWDFGQFPPENIVWNGFDSNGRLADDGKYKFELRATDLAGNIGIITTNEPFLFSTKEAKILLSLSDAAFSPNGNKVKETISFVPVLKDADGIANYKLEIKDSKSNVIRTFTEAGNLPAKFEWNGKNTAGIICADGTYFATLTVNSISGSSATVTTPGFELDTVAPSLVATAPWTDFSPDGDSNQDVLPLYISNCSAEDLWKAEIKNASGKVVKTYTWKGKIRSNGKDMFEWDGSDESGNKAGNGSYSVTINSEDKAGNTFKTVISGINLDSRETKVYVTAEHEGISPNGDSVLDTQVFKISTSVPEGILSWNFDIRSENGTSVRGWSNKDSANLPSSITWDGLDSNGTVCEGTFTGTLNVVYKKGNKVSTVSSPFICTATPPQLSVRTAPVYFSPDNDGTDDDLFIKLSGSSKAMIKNWSFVIKDPLGKAFWTTSGKSSITERIIWDGLSNVQKNKNGRAERVQSATDYPYEFKVTDNLGMTSVVNGKISVDVLVIRDGDVLKMAVPSIIFRSDNADFKTVAEVGKGGLDPDKAHNNEVVLKRIAEILNKFKEYRVTIVGHANRLTDNEAEETTDNPKLWGPALQPLSEKRANYVKNYLIKQGVSASRLSAEGRGGSELVVDYKDKDNNWKNRRVEFILEK